MTTDRGLLLVFLVFVAYMAQRTSGKDFTLVVGLAFVGFLLLEQSAATQLLGSITTDINSISSGLTGGLTTLSGSGGTTNGTTTGAKK